MRKIVAIILAFIMAIQFVPASVGAYSKLTDAQEDRAERIYNVVASNWNKYGCLPSVCIAQAFVESTLGDHCPGNNLWGIASGAIHYSSIEEGALAYCKVINNGYYKGAPFETNPYRQIRKILDGGYCQPEGAYYSNAVWAIEHYNFKKYDKRMFNAIKKNKRKHRKKLQQKTFTLRYDASLESYEIRVDKSVIPKGDVIMENGYIYEVSKFGSEKFVIGVPCREWDGQKMNITVVENAVG